MKHLFVLTLALSTTFCLASHAEEVPQQQPIVHFGTGDVTAVEEAPPLCPPTKTQPAGGQPTACLARTAITVQTPVAICRESFGRAAVTSLAAADGKLDVFVSLAKLEKPRDPNSAVCHAITLVPVKLFIRGKWQSDDVRVHFLEEQEGQ